MFGEIAQAHDLPLTFVMPAVVVEGTFRARIRRIADVLNDPDSHQMVLTDATFINIATGRRSARAAVARISLSEVLLVHATRPLEDSGQPRSAKRPVKANVLLPPFAVEGTLHLVHERELRTAIMSLTDQWIPLTNARYWGLGVALPPVKVDFAMINQVRAQIAISNAEEWGRSAAPPADEPGADAWLNPW